MGYPNITNPLEQLEVVLNSLGYAELYPPQFMSGNNDTRRMASDIYTPMSQLYT